MECTIGVEGGWSRLIDAQSTLDQRHTEHMECTIGVEGGWSRVIDTQSTLDQRQHSRIALSGLKPLEPSQSHSQMNPGLLNIASSKQMRNSLDKVLDLGAIAGPSEPKGVYSEARHNSHQWWLLSHNYWDEKMEVRHFVNQRQSPRHRKIVGSSPNHAEYSLWLWVWAPHRIPSCNRSNKPQS